MDYTADTRQERILKLEAEAKGLSFALDAAQETGHDPYHTFVKISHRFIEVREQLFREHAKNSTQVEIQEWVINAPEKYRARAQQLLEQAVREYESVGREKTTTISANYTAVCYVSGDRAVIDLTPTEDEEGVTRND